MYLHNLWTKFGRSKSYLRVLWKTRFRDRVSLQWSFCNRVFAIEFLQSSFCNRVFTIEILQSTVRDRVFTIEFLQSSVHNRDFAIECSRSQSHLTWVFEIEFLQSKWARDWDHAEFVCMCIDPHAWGPRDEQLSTVNGRTQWRPSQEATRGHRCYQLLALPSAWCWWTAAGVYTSRYLQYEQESFLLQLQRRTVPAPVYPIHLHRVQSYLARRGVLKHVINAHAHAQIPQGLVPMSIASTRWKNKNAKTRLRTLDCKNSIANTRLQKLDCRETRSRNLDFQRTRK